MSKLPRFVAFSVACERAALGSSHTVVQSKDQDVLEKEKKKNIIGTTICLRLENFIFVF